MDRADSLNREIQETLPPWKMEGLKAEKAKLRSNYTVKKVSMTQPISSVDSDITDESEVAVMLSEDSESPTPHLKESGHRAENLAGESEDDSEVGVLVKHIEHLQKRLEEAETKLRSRGKKSRCINFPDC